MKRFQTMCPRNISQIYLDGTVGTVTSFVAAGEFLALLIFGLHWYQLNPLMQKILQSCIWSICMGIEYY